MLTGALVGELDKDMTDDRHIPAAGSGRVDAGHSELEAIIERIRKPRETRCLALMSTPQYTLFYDPCALNIAKWMRMKDAWLGTLEAAVFGVGFGVLRTSDSDVVAGMLVQNYNGFDTEVGIASDDPMAWRRKFVQYMFEYLYNTMRVTRVTCRIAEDNDDSLRLARGLGFTHEGCIRAYRHGIDYHILGMLRDECRWLKETSHD